LAKRAANPAAARAAAGDKPTLRGRFLTFEGVDGCGKTTQARLLGERLCEAGLPVLETREPGGTEIGRQLRAVLLSADNAALAPLTELLLFLADRVQHLRETIRPALARGEVVLCDRFHDATVAYQQYGRGLELASLQPFISAQILAPPPDATFWLDLDVQRAAIRRAGRQRPEQQVLLEELAGAGAPASVIAARSQAQAEAVSETRLDAAETAFHERVRAGYAAIQAAEPGRVLRIDAGGAPQATHERIWHALTERYDVV
jgi:dTMP kinase